MLIVELLVDTSQISIYLFICLNNKSKLIDFDFMFDCLTQRKLISNMLIIVLLFEMTLSRIKLSTINRKKKTIKTMCEMILH